MREKSGTGKSTLFKILLGFEKLSEGSVYIGQTLKSSDILAGPKRGGLFFPEN